jgi:TRAP-type C4-dicarboxylate transport system permease large subunit
MEAALSIVFLPVSILGVETPPGYPVIVVANLAVVSGHRIFLCQISPNHLAQMLL